MISPQKSAPNSSPPGTPGPDLCGDLLPTCPLHQSPGCPWCVTLSTLSITRGATSWASLDGARTELLRASGSYLQCCWGAAWARGSQEGLDSGCTSLCLFPPPMKVVPAFPRSGGPRGLGRRAGRAGQAASQRGLPRGRLWPFPLRVAGIFSLGELSEEASRGGSSSVPAGLWPLPPSGAKIASCEELTRSAPVRPPGQSWITRQWAHPGGSWDPIKQSTVGPGPGSLLRSQPQGPERWRGSDSVVVFS